MGYVALPDDLKSLIELQVAEGRAASEADFVAEAVRLYADYLQSGDNIAAMMKRADADMAAGRYVTVATPGDSEAAHQQMVGRLRAKLAEGAAGG